MDVALLTAGRDPHYAYGLVRALASQRIHVDLVGGDALKCPEWDTTQFVQFKNLKGDASDEASLPAKVLRILVYYGKLLAYAATARPKLFHILWNNKLETFDRVVLMLYYKLLGKKPVLTVHNVNAGVRDSNDSFLNRLTLKIQYSLSEHLFVHTERMKRELIKDFGVPHAKISVIPFGINDAVPETRMTSRDAKNQLGLGRNARVMLFFGHIAPYKGLEYLIKALSLVQARGGDYRLIIAGKPKNHPQYWSEIRESIDQLREPGRIIEQIKHIPDEETEVYFKAADVLVLPYRHIYQSGVLFLGYSFGLPVIASDVGAINEDVIEGVTGFMCKPEDPADLARVIQMYFTSSLYENLDSRRQEVMDIAFNRHSWDTVGRLTQSAYNKLLG